MPLAIAPFNSEGWNLQQIIHRVKICKVHTIDSKLIQQKLIDLSSHTCKMHTN